MGRLITYDSLNNKMVFNMASADLENIVTGSTAGISYVYGSCSTRNNNLAWACGTYYNDFDTSYYTALRAYQPFNMNYQIGDDITGFTLIELIDRGYYTPGTAATFYLNTDKTDYITIQVNGGTPNDYGKTCYSSCSVSIRYNGTTKNIRNWSGGSVMYNCGFAQGTYNGVTGYYFFWCEESTSNGHRVRNVTFPLDNFGTLIPYYVALYENYGGKPIDEIPITPGNDPIGGFSNIANFEGDDIELPDAPDETVSGVLASGFLNIYKPTDAQLRDFGGALWTNAFNVKWTDIDSISNLVLNAVSNPIDFIIGLFMLPVTPDSGNPSGIFLGGINVNTVSAPRVTSQYKTIDFGTINIDELYGNYLDYSNSRVSIYLPYVGTADIDVQEITGGSIHLQYIVDCFTGACVANVHCLKVTNAPWGIAYTNKTVHSYSGNMALQLPISAGSFDTLTQGLINVGLGLGTNTPAVAMSGAKDVMQGFAGDVTTRGSLSSNTGKLGYQTPYLMFTRPIESRPANLGELHGYSAGVGGILSQFKGYVECSDVKLDGVTATDNELNEIESILKSGVYV